MKISVSVWVKSPLATVWQCWNTPASIMAWNAASEDWHTDSSRVDLRVGGRFCHHMAARDGSIGFDFEGTFTAVDPPGLLDYVMDDGREVQVRFREGAGEPGWRRCSTPNPSIAKGCNEPAGRASSTTSSGIWKARPEARFFCLPFGMLTLPRPAAPGWRCRPPTHGGPGERRAHWGAGPASWEYAA